jgi:small subunit ribosomal protein S20
LAALRGYPGFFYKKSGITTRIFNKKVFNQKRSRQVPQRKTGIKELKKNKARKLHNLDIKTDLRKTVKSFMELVGSKPEEARTFLNTLYKKFDKAAKRNIMSKNTASRRKARYAKLLIAKPSAEKKA